MRCVDPGGGDPHCRSLRRRRLRRAVRGSCAEQRGRGYGYKLGWRGHHRRRPVHVGRRRTAPRLRVNGFSRGSVPGSGVAASCDASLSGRTGTPGRPHVGGLLMGSSRGDRAAVARVAPTSARWREERTYLNAHRHELAVRAQQLYPEAWRLEGTPLLARASWLPESPLPLDQVVVSWQAEVAGAGVTGREPASSGVRPLRAAGGQYACYADSVRELSRPRLFEDRVCYSILSVDVCDAAA